MEEQIKLKAEIYDLLCQFDGLNAQAKNLQQVIQEKQQELNNLLTKKE